MQDDQHWYNMTSWPLGASLSKADPSLSFILDILRHDDASDSLPNGKRTLWYERKQ